MGANEHTLKNNFQSNQPSKRAIIGGKTQRTNSIGKVTGRTQYVEDIVMPGMLYAVVLRSPHHHARLLSLNPQPALSTPGVVVY